MSLWQFMKWIWRGKSARRAFLNIEVSNRVALQGLVLDIGGKGQPSYREVLQDSDKATWVVIDISPSKEVSVLGDLTSMPLKEDTFNAVIRFNVLEHVYNYHAALGEIGRVLKINGVLYGYVPFLINVHPDPSDYWRFTGDCLNRCLSEAGFSVDCIIPHCGVFISCFDLVSFVANKIPPIHFLLAALFLLADSLLSCIRPSLAQRFPVGYFFIGRKSCETSERHISFGSTLDKG